MLKPTVGIELCEASQFMCRSHPSALLAITATDGKPDPALRDIHILDRKLAALLGYVRRCLQYQGRTSNVMRSRSPSLTARTLSNDVLPAFCNPIIVMSISVALWIQSKPPSATCHSGYIYLLFLSRRLREDTNSAGQGNNNVTSDGE